MVNEIYKGIYADHIVRYQFLHKDTFRYLSGFLTKSDDVIYDIQMSAEHFDKCKEILIHETDGYVECKGLITLTSQFLLKHLCCIFHSVSFVYKGYAWLISAPSGTGKTTQYKNWMRLYPEEIKMISGDMPLLEMRDNRIYVHPTGWNGKERIGNQLSAPLGGVIWLKQDAHNNIRSLSAKEGLLSIYRQFRTITDTEEEIRNLSAIIDCMFRYYPIWLMNNLGDEESTSLLRFTINSYLEQEKSI